ncbi:MAG: class I SAM-dependent methyltransferase [Lachnospiraceae bacterium]|jgi:ubiquinone/menaquinone biosynthesis C-methylase UbiE|nr:class I SAM-dependent methyltransferase [Lachnospiraceae bacterium]MCI1656241.1 class I SAM-dependent methyltransferase [Lachnospiraceae bacterium]MCI2194723.1 class I SAM-dependent methyltransferase [Lachnospiraceae bacterium]
MAIRKKDWEQANPGKPAGESGRAMVRRMNDSHRPLRDWAFSYVNWMPGMRILDVGCGGGAAIADMLQLSEDSVIDGVDYSADCVAATKETNGALLGTRVFVQEGNVGSLPYEGEQFDLVTAVETVYFWPDLLRGLNEIFRVLKTGGHIAILCEVDGPERMDWEKVNFEINVYTPVELREYLHQAGFSQVEYHVLDNGYTMLYGCRQDSHDGE